MGAEKTYVKLKDATSIFMIMEQGITVVGKLPQEVKKTPSVIRAVKHGILEYTKKPKASKSKNSQDKALALATKKAEEALEEAKNTLTESENSVKAAEDVAKDLSNKAEKAKGDKKAAADEAVEKAYLAVDEANATLIEAQEALVEAEANLEGVGQGK